MNDLIHSEDYLGSDYTNGLMHWKYLRKYKNSRGKWVYVYGNKQTHLNLLSKQTMIEANKKSHDHYYKTGYKDGARRHSDIAEKIEREYENDLDKHKIKSEKITNFINKYLASKIKEF